MEVGAVVRALGGMRGAVVRGCSAARGSRGKHNMTEPPSFHTQSGLSALAQSHTCQIEGLGARLGQQPVLANLEQHRSRVAISDVHGDYTYEDVYLRSWDLAKGILGLLGQAGPGQRICFLCPSGLSHVIVTWASWISGNVAVPLCPSSSPSRLEHLIQDSACSMVITTTDQVAKVQEITKRHGQKTIVLDSTWWSEPKLLGDQGEALPPPLAEVGSEGPDTALILYTAGATTGQARGVALTHTILNNQIERVVDAWDWGPQDSVLHCLNLGSAYGLINSLQAPLSTGARITLMPQFDPVKVWSQLLGVGVNSGKPLTKVTTFPGLPSQYVKLLTQAEVIFKDKKARDYVKATCSKRLRLMMSSSATLPSSVTLQWKNVTGHRILENYISTEAGTALCNRVAGSGKVAGPGCQDCGAPIGGMNTRVVRFRDHTKSSYDVLATGSCQGTEVTEGQDSSSVIGELMLKGEHTAKHYWMEGNQVPIKTQDGWIDTGDIVQVHKGCYKVLGRLGIKSINSKGQQVSAVTIEKKLLSCGDITDCYVLGLGDTQAEQKVAAVIVLNPNKKVNLEAILKWCGEHMEEAEVPTVFKMVGEIARDSMGHVAKLRLAELFPDTEVICYHDTKM